MTTDLQDIVETIEIEDYELLGANIFEEDTQWIKRYFALRFDGLIIEDQRNVFYAVIDSGHDSIDKISTTILQALPDLSLSHVDVLFALYQISLKIKFSDFMAHISNFCLFIEDNVFVILKEKRGCIEFHHEGLCIIAIAIPQE
jgi:hypothetical protein